jgi:hypothetical protein
MDTPTIDELSSTYLSDPNASFVAEFIDGYSFRNLVELIRAVSSTCNFRFSSEGISYEQADPEQCVIMRWMIYASELIDYSYNSTNPSTMIGININNLRSITKTIGKKDGIKIYKVPGEAPVYIQIGASEKGTDRRNVCTIVPQEVDQVYYDIQPYEQGDDSPNCVVQTATFAKVCTSITSVKCKLILVTSNKRGITLSTITDLGTTSRAETLGTGAKSRPPVDNGEVYIKTKFSIIKALSKINNLSSQGTIKFYSQPGNPIKMTSRIGSYGSLEIYLLAPPEE